MLRSRVKMTFNSVQFPLTVHLQHTKAFFLFLWYLADTQYNGVRLRILTSFHDFAICKRPNVEQKKIHLLCNYRADLLESSSPRLMPKKTRIFSSVSRLCRARHSLNQVDNCLAAVQTRVFTLGFVSCSRSVPYSAMQNESFFSSCST